jgi:hypothetical protein
MCLEYPLWLQILLEQYGEEAFTLSHLLHHFSILALALSRVTFLPTRMSHGKRPLEESSCASGAPLPIRP